MGLIGGKDKLGDVVGDVDFSQLAKSAARSTIQAALNGEGGKAIPSLVGSAGAYETGKAVKRSRGVGKSALILAGGVAAVTAASAAISAVRHGHQEG
jgi:hypothetical protein